jgi:hypothetical protein
VHPHLSASRARSEVEREKCGATNCPWQFANHETVANRSVASRVLVVSVASRQPLHGAIVAVFALVFALTAPDARADPATRSAADARADAAAAFDRGVHAYDRQAYVVAARSFLEADTLAPSSDAITNAFAAAQHAGDRALLEQVRERALERDPPEPALAERIRALLAESPAPTAREQAPVAANAPVPPAAPASEKEPVSPRTSGPRGVPREEGHRSGGTWSPAVFYAGLGATALLAGATVWSGLDTEAARDRLPGTRRDNDGVVARAHRTDALLADTLVLAGATAYVGLKLVAWKGSDAGARVVAVADSHGAALIARGAW